MAWGKAAGGRELDLGSTSGAPESREMEHGFFSQQIERVGRGVSVGRAWLWLEAEGWPGCLAYRPDDPQGGQRLVIASPV